MTMVLDESVPITYNWNEPVSPTAGGPNLAISPVPPSEDDSAAEDLRSTSQLREHREAKLISPKTAYAGDSRWSGVGEHLFTSRIAERFSGAFPVALFGLEQSNDEAREEGLPAPLANALRDLHELIAEAHEEEIAPPSESAMADAKRVLRAIYDILPRDYVMDLFPEGVIAIIVPGGFNRSVMVLCESDGGALCSINMNGKHRRKRYLRTDQLLPDSFLREALRELERE